MKILHLTDLHLTEGRDLQHQKNVLDAIVLRAMEDLVDATIITGDLYGLTVPHRSTPKERAVLYPVVAELSKIGPVVILYGNHDYPGDLETLEHVGRRYAVRVVSRAESMTVDTKSGKFGLFAMPWPTKRRVLEGIPSAMSSADSRELATQQLRGTFELWGAMASANSKLGRPQIFAAHITVTGSKLDNGTVIRSADLEIPEEWINSMTVDAGLLGHAHTQQSPVTLSPEIQYGGSMFPNTFGETGERTFSIVEIGLNDRGFMDASKLQYETVFHKIPTEAPQKITLDWRWHQKEDGSFGWAERPTDDDLLVGVNNMVRARLSAPKEAKASVSWAAEIERIKAVGPIYVVEEHSVESTVRSRAPKIAKAETLNDKLDTYWRASGVELSQDERGDVFDELAAIEGGVV